MCVCVCVVRAHKRRVLDPGCVHSLLPVAIIHVLHGGEEGSPPNSSRFSHIFGKATAKNNQIFFFFLNFKAPKI